MKNEQFIPMIAYEEFFWLNFKIHHDERDVRMTITHVPQINLQFWLKIKLCIPKYTSELEPPVYEVSSIMYFNDLTGDRDNFLSLPYSTIKRVLDRGDDLTYDLSIERIPVPDFW